MIRRYLTLAIVLAALIAVFLNPLKIDLKVGSSAPVIETSVKAQDLSLICPGALYQAGGTSGTSLGNSRLGSAAIIGGLSAKNLSLAGGLALPAAITESTAFTVVDPDGLAKQGSSLFNASQAQIATAKNLSGLATANCVRPTSDSWLVGGDTSIGRETLLILANRSAVDSAVNLEILGSGGSISAPGLSSISVPAGKNTVIPLSSLVPNLSTFSVHVIATGGSIGAWLQQRTLRSLSAGGVDYIAPSIDSQTQVLIPGIFLRGVADAAKLIAANPDYEDLQPMLRLLNATDQSATVTAQILGANAKTFGTVIQQVVPARSTIDVVITGLANGDYFAIVDSDQPIRSSIRMARTKVAQNDFTWLAAAEPFTEERAISVPAGAISKLALVNANSEVATVTLRVGASTFTHKVGARGTLSLLVPEASVVYLRSDVAVAVGEVVDVSGLVSSLSVIDYRNLGGKVAISIR